MSKYCKECIHDEVCGLTHCGQSIACVNFKQVLENKPITMEELRQMDGEPVFLDVASGVWGLVDTDDFVVWLDRGGSIDISKIVGKAYRHKPEEEQI